MRSFPERPSDGTRASRRRPASSLRRSATGTGSRSTRRSTVGLRRSSTAAPSRSVSVGRRRGASIAPAFRPTVRCSPLNTPNMGTCCIRRSASSTRGPERPSASRWTRGSRLRPRVGRPSRGINGSRSCTNVRARERPAIWDLKTGTRQDLAIEVDGVVEVHDWWPDASALLLINLYEGRDRLFRYEVATGTLTPISAPEGTIFQARVRPDGNVWYRHSTGVKQAIVFDEAGAEVLAPSERAPEGRPYESWHFPNGLGDTVHGFYVTPPGPGPHPMMMFVHGGPTWLDTDRFSPEVQAYVDEGFAVGMVNYRGSIGYGQAWRDTLIGNIGGPELEDVNAGLGDLVARGIADPDASGDRRLVVGRLHHADGARQAPRALALRCRRHPGRRLRGELRRHVAAASGLRSCAPRWRPRDVPELMRERNPIYFADDVTAPVLFVAGENDSRCPIRPGDALRRQVEGEAPPPRGVHVRDRSLVVRCGRDGSPDARHPRLPAAQRLELRPAVVLGTAATVAPCPPG